MWLIRGSLYVVRNAGGFGWSIISSMACECVALECHDSSVWLIKSTLTLIDKNLSSDWTHVHVTTWVAEFIFQPMSATVSYLVVNFQLNSQT